MVGATWAPDGRRMVAVSADLAQLFLFDFVTGKWTELVKAQPSGLQFSPDGQYLQYLDSSGTGVVWKIRLSDGHKEKVVDLSNFVGAGYYGFVQLYVAPDGSPLLLRDTGTQDIYSLDWQEP
jgi:WD40 repeat protein